jgi:hypothetical protein
MAFLPQLGEFRDNGKTWEATAIQDESEKAIALLMWDWIEMQCGAQLPAYNTPMKILFLHGWQSVPGGVKPSFLAQHGHEVINPKLPDDDFPKAVRIAQEESDKHQPDVGVGSSRGGAVAMNPGQSG